MYVRLSQIAMSRRATLLIVASVTLSQTRFHLEYLHLQILSVVTSRQLQRIFEKRTNFDLRRLLEGTCGHVLAVTCTPKLTSASPSAGFQGRKDSCERSLLNLRATWP